MQCENKTGRSKMTSCAEAMFYLNHCPGTEMDGDQDGIRSGADIKDLESKACFGWLFKFVQSKLWTPMQFEAIDSKLRTAESKPGIADSKLRMADSKFEITHTKLRMADSKFRIAGLKL